MPEAEGSALAVVASGLTEKGRGKSPLLSWNRQAECLGVIPGLTANQALARVPQLLIHDRCPSQEKALTSQLLSYALKLSPNLELTSPDTILADLATLQRAIQDPEKWLQNLTLECPFAYHFLHAPTPDLAALAVPLTGPAHFLPHARELSHFPLQDLPLPFRLTEALTLWGLKYTGDFTRLPHDEVQDRLGPEAAHYHQIFNGHHHRLLKLHRPSSDFSRKVDFEDPITTLGSLLNAFHQELTTLCHHLTRAYRVASEIHLTLEFEKGPPLRKILRVAEPNARPEALLSILQAALENTSGPSAINHFSLTLTPTIASRAQADLFQPSLKDPTRFHETLSRIEALVGIGKLGTPELAKTHRPDSFQLLSPKISAPKSTPPNPKFLPSLPLRRFRPSPEIRVLQHDQHPAAILDGPFPGRIATSSGPIRLSSEWWEPAKAWKIAEWDIQLEAGHLLRLTHTPKSWVLTGIYG